MNLFEIEKIIHKKSNAFNTQQQKSEGKVYTPLNIAEYIIKKIKPNINETILEPSIGHGIFIFVLIDFVHKEYNLKSVELKKYIERRIYGFDIDNNSLLEFKELFREFCLENYNIKNLNLDNFKCEDGLKNKKVFDIIIGNPPYVAAKNLDNDYLKWIKKTYSFCSIGKTDLYYAFLDNAIKYSKRTGFIIPNTFITNMSAKNIRKNIKKHIVELIDFREKLIFKNNRTYTSILILDKEKKTENFNLYNDINKFYSKIKKIDLQDDKWNFYIDNNKENILNDYISTNVSIATLSDKIFILKDIKNEDSNYYYVFKEGKKFQIEKSITKDLLKASKKEYFKIIFPYINGKVIDINKMKAEFPKTLEYFLYFKNKLLERDKGKANNYKEFYCYGREQGIKDELVESTKIVLPSIYNENSFFFIESKKGEIVSNGISLIVKKDKILDLKKILNSKDFQNYLIETGRKLPGNKFNYIYINSSIIKNYRF